MCAVRGASMGNLTVSVDRERNQDGYEMVDWVVKQHWCSGSVGAAGISYSGTAGGGFWPPRNTHGHQSGGTHVFALRCVRRYFRTRAAYNWNHFASNWAARSQRGVGQ